ncbi:MAG: NAD-dependent epimerase/dehydratase family protein [Pseudomonadota bacterium]
MTDLSEPLFLLGPGYSGHALARIWPGKVYGTVRSERSRDKLAGSVIEPVEINQQDALKRSVAGAHLVISAPPEATGCPAFDLVGAHVASARSVTYLSTTGVYGDLQGGWAMEWTAPKPTSDRARRRVQAEQIWQAASEVVRIVRLPGIYGPGRSALDRIRSGKARRIVRDGQVFSRIHVDDIATGLKALLGAGQTGVYHLCDDEAAPPQDVIACAADLLQVAPPPEVSFEQADLSDMARSFYSECKRVSNAKIKAATGWRPLYSTYREGLRAIHASEN